MPRVRLASALLVPEPFAREIDGLRRALGEDLSRVPPHLTLVPPVNVRVTDIGAALAQVRVAAASSSPLVVTLGPAVTFHPVNPVVYLSVGGDVDGVRAIRERVFTGPLSRKVEHEFVPHVTLVESTTPDRIEAALVALADYQVEVTFESVHLLQEGDRVWRPIAEARFEPALIVGRGGIETEITTSSVADPEVAEFMGERSGGEGGGEGAERVVVARRDGVVVAAACARDGALMSFVGDPDLERQLLKVAAAT
jgi:2'-5' RNA ligase